jgi:KUP system potassium uptake protein
MTDTAAAPALPADRPPASAHHHQGSLGKLMLGAVGVVYGDIGTSPLYAFRETFAAHGGRALLSRMPSISRAFSASSSGR